MGYVADPQTQERKLRAVEAAAASAVGNGCNPDAVRQRVEAGIAAVVSGSREVPAPRSVDTQNPQPVELAAGDSTEALDAFQRAVGF